MKVKFSVFYIIIFTLCLTACVPVDNSSSTGANKKVSLRIDDYTYDKNIKTVMLYPVTGQNHDMIQAPIIPLSQGTPLVLHFDELVGQVNDYTVKILNCTYNWRVSDLPELQYLNDFNEYIITDRNVSFNTRVNYVHYKFVVPRVKVSGNYLIVVYRNNNPDDIVISRRFVITDDKLSLAPDVKFSNVVSKRNHYQQVDFVLNYKGIDVINPTDEIKVVIRQNHRWDNALMGLRPAYVREFEKRLDYNFFAGENNFPGGNEFRMFDVRSIQFSGMNVDKVILQETPIEVNLLRDRSRAKEPYSQYPDADGKFYVEHYETGGVDVEPDYVYVNFRLDHPYPADGKVYIIGTMNDWIPDKRYEMKYDEEKKRYNGKVLLKQGYYNYIYTLTAPGMRDDTYFEGNHSLTQNHYEIIVYYRPMGFRSDLIVGYKNFNYNSVR
ncbi:MAG: DUF5103 domain-containing protein [Cytophagaceae bacterium]